MIDPQQQAKNDQQMAQFIEVIPPMVRQFYLKLVEEGFNEGEAFRLTENYVHGLVGGKR